MATPFVSGAAALLLAATGQRLGMPGVRQALLDTVEPLQSHAGKCSSGVRGRSCGDLQEGCALPKVLTGGPTSRRPGAQLCSACAQFCRAYLCPDSLRLLAALRRAGCASIWRFGGRSRSQPSGVVHSRTGLHLCPLQRLSYCWRHSRRRRRPKSGDRRPRHHYKPGSAGPLRQRQARRSGAGRRRPSARSTASQRPRIHRKDSLCLLFKCLPYLLILLPIVKVAVSPSRLASLCTTSVYLNQAFLTATMAVNNPAVS